MLNRIEAAGVADPIVNIREHAALAPNSTVIKIVVLVRNRSHLTEGI
jgi:hypothetical protein